MVAAQLLFGLHALKRGCFLIISPFREKIKQQGRDLHRKLKYRERITHGCKVAIHRAGDGEKYIPAFPACESKRRLSMSKTEKKCPETREIPILNIRVMSDDEWNRLAYLNWLERRCHA